MNNLYIFGGYVFTGGTLSDGKPWQGMRIMLAPVKEANQLPVKADACKASRTDSLVEIVKKLSPGQPVTVYFDMNGRVIELRTLPTR